MKLQRLCTGLAGCMLMLTGWICAPLQAQQSPPAPEAAAAAFPKGPLPPHVAEQVRDIVVALVKASQPPAEEGAVAIARFSPDESKGAIKSLRVVVDGQTYSAEVYRPFLAEPGSQDEFFGHEGNYFVRTTSPWTLKDGVVIPADTYLSGIVERVSAYDHDTIVAQDEAIARSDDLCKAALAQLQPEKKAKAEDAVSDAHKADMDSLTKQITQLKTDVAQKQAARSAIVAQINNRPPKVPVIRRDSNNKILWQWSPTQGFSFNDGLEQSQQTLDQDTAAQKALQATMDAELAVAVAQASPKETAIRRVFQKQRRSILAGETISAEDMHADYDAALGEALIGQPASGKAQPGGPTDGKPPIQVVPKPGT